MSGSTFTMHPLLNQSVFVAGTDTGVGKTWFCRQLLAAWGAAGHRAAAMKPVAAGADATPAGLRNEDALALAAAANLKLPYSEVNPVCLPAPTSPHLAARDAGEMVDLDAIKRAYASIVANKCHIVVEGAGGWLAPIGEPPSAGAPGPTMQDVALALNLPVVLVVGIRLGALSHALLAAQAIRGSGLPLLGWVGNCLEPEFVDAERYIEALSVRLPEPMLWRS